MKNIFCMFVLILCVVSAFSQNTVPLDKALDSGVKYFEGRITRGTKLVVLNVKSPAPQLSEYIEEELTACFVNNSSFTLADRTNLALLQKEMDFQLSGEVSDDDVRLLGKKLGAQTVITGSIEVFGDIFRLRIRAIEIESAAIQGIYTANIQKDRFLTSLGTPPAPGGNTSSEHNSPSGNTQPTQNPRPGSGGRVSLPDYLLN